MTELPNEPLAPLFEEDESTVIERMRAYANEGLTESNPAWVDTREGSMWWTCSMPGAREIARLYDLAGTDMIQAVLPQFSWSEYLDALAAVQGLVRAPAVAARVVVTFHAPQGTQIPSGTQVATTPAEGSGLTPVQFTTTESVTVGSTGKVAVNCEAVEPGSEGNVAAQAINTLVSGVGGVESLTNEAAAFGGADEESDEALAAELLGVYQGNPVAQVRWYVKTTQKWLTEHDGERCPHGGRVSVKPLWNGAGTILVIAMDNSGNPLEASVVSALQAYLDPATPQIEGAAPPAAEVTVQTGTTLTVEVAAHVHLKTGYNLTGANGLIAVKTQLESAIVGYLGALEAGQEVVRAELIAVIMSIEGVKDCKEVKLQGAEANVTPTSTQVPRTESSKITLTEY